jgi:hypothetical protein
MFEQDLKRGFHIMCSDRLRFLVIDSEYLIALETTRMLAERFDCNTVIGGLDDEIAELAAERFDVVLLDTRGVADADGRRANKVLATGASLVFTSAYLDLANGVAGFEDWPVVMKPFTSQDLADVVSLSLMRAGKAARV